MLTIATTFRSWKACNKVGFSQTAQTCVLFRLKGSAFIYIPCQSVAIGKNDYWLKREPVKVELSLPWQGISGGFFDLILNFWDVSMSYYRNLHF
jgi:hypothetical protein